MAPKKNAPKSDPTLPFTPVTIDGKEYKLCLDFEAIGQIEAELAANGHPDINLLVTSWTINARTLPTLFAAGLRIYHPDLGFDEAKRLVNWKNSMDLTVAVRAAQGRFSGTGDEAAEGEDAVDPPTAPVPVS